MGKGFDPFAGGYSAEGGPEQPTPPKGGTARTDIDNWPKVSEKERCVRDTATLVELLEAEHQHWSAVRELHRNDVNGRAWYQADRILGHIEALQQTYRETTNRE